MIGWPHGRPPRLALVALLLAVASAFASAPAYARVVHHIETTFSGEGAGTLGGDLLAAAVDNSGGASQGDVYVLESKPETSGGGDSYAVDKFTAAGAFTGVRITGSQTAPKSFQFSPFFSGVAVDSSLSVNAGDVYVSDNEHDVVDRFNEDGEFVCQIAGVKTEAKDPSAKECAGAGSGLAGKVTPAGLAVDSSGDVYVANDANGSLDEFGSGGNLIRAIKVKDHLSKEMMSIALDSSGDLYVTLSKASVVELDSTGAFQRELGENAVGVAVNGASTPNEVYVDEEGVVKKENNEKVHEPSSLSEYEPSSGALRTRTVLPGPFFFPGLAVDAATGTIYAASAELVVGDPQGDGVDVVSPDVVLPNVATEAPARVESTRALLQGHVEPDVAHGDDDVTTCAFEYVTEDQFHENGYTGAASAACQAATPLPYAEPESVSAEVPLAPSTTYRYRVVAGDAAGVNDGEGEEKPEAKVTTSGPPAVVAESAEARTQAATLTAQINPFDFETTCQVQVVDEAEFVASGYSHARTLACPHAVGAGFATESASVEVSGLTIGTTYHYRFLASNETGSTTGADQTFATFELSSFTFETLDGEGRPYTQAGGHPYLIRTSFKLNRNGSLAQATIRDTETRLPPGLIGNPTAVAQCTREQLTEFECPGAAQVGVITLELYDSTTHEDAESFKDDPIYNLVPPEGVPAEFGVRYNSFTNLYIDSNVRTGGDYGVTARVSNASPAVGIVGATVELWGVPAAESHDAQRECPVAPGERNDIEKGPCSAGIAPAPFLREPTSCGGELSASMSVDTWQDPGAFVSRTTAMPAITGCESLDFTPSLSLAPSTDEADSPSGLALDLKLPQEQAPEGLGASDLKSNSLALPVGVSANPSAAAGLQACSPAQIGLDDESEPSCPEASKIGEVEIETPLLSNVVKGSVYVAEQDNNPFGSLLAIYLVAQADGALVKLAGHIEANPETGQLTTSFENLPQLPFSDLRLHLFGGPRATLATPESCGTVVSSSTWGPWSGIAAVTLSNPFSISAGCVSGFAPSFSAGSASVQAGAYTPLVFSFSREDGEQELSGLTATLPTGLAAKLAGVPLCSDTAASSGTCPEESRVGTVTAYAGSGADPLVLHGSAYLTGPYKGAPYGMAVEVPAIAGPFNLGTVTVRQALYVDPHDAHVTAVSDPFPTILDVKGANGQTDGFPVRLRRVDVSIDRPDFTFNPTNCEAKSIAATFTSTSGASASRSTPFAVTGCPTLPFAPVLSASAVGQGSKADGTAFSVTVSSGGLGSTGAAQAGIAKVDLQLPKQLSSRLTTLQKACPAATFEANPSNCDEGSVIGHATIHTPILSNPLTGPAYLVSHGGEAFPDVEFVLQGENITLILDGKTDIKNGITYSKFESTPDAPFTTFETVLPAGPHGVLTPNVAEAKHFDLCGETLAMPTTIVGQNGVKLEQSTKIAIEGCGAVKSAKARKLTLAQQLKRALAHCRSAYKHSKSKRIKCERAAHARYAKLALAACRRSDKHSKKQRVSCEGAARRRYGAHRAKGR